MPISDTSGPVDTVALARAVFRGIEAVIVVERFPIGAFLIGHPGASPGIDGELPMSLRP